jgi:hypothetical protein
VEKYFAKVRILHILRFVSICDQFAEQLCQLLRFLLGLLNARLIVKDLEGNGWGRNLI